MRLGGWGNGRYDEVVKDKGVAPVDTRDAIRTEFMRIYERESVGRITVKGLCAAVPVARDGCKAMRAGKAVCLQGAFTKAMAVGSRLVPRAIARKVAMRMNR